MSRELESFRGSNGRMFVSSTNPRERKLLVEFLRIDKNLTPEEEQTYANLFAYSPDLLQASADLVAYLDSWTEADLPGGFKLLTALREAIKKAS